ncbi:hypothetical protein ADL26_13625, partial [Thermoactinomyces vulgaris]
RSTVLGTEQLPHSALAALREAAEHPQSFDQVRGQRARSDSILSEEFPQALVDVEDRLLGNEEDVVIDAFLGLEPDDGGKVVLILHVQLGGRLGLAGQRCLRLGVPGGVPA